MTVKEAKCNETEFFVYEDKVTGKFQATRSINRCIGAPCMYHIDCETGFCLKRDFINTVDVEGICVFKTKLYNECTLTYGNISAPTKTNSQAISLNRCEFVPCLFDQECADGLFCHDNRYC